MLSYEIERDGRSQLLGKDVHFEQICFAVVSGSYFSSHQKTVMPLANSAVLKSRLPKYVCLHARINAYTTLITFTWMRFNARDRLYELKTIASKRIAAFLLSPTTCQPISTQKRFPNHRDRHPYTSRWIRCQNKFLRKKNNEITTNTLNFMRQIMLKFDGFEFGC